MNNRFEKALIEDEEKLKNVIVKGFPELMIANFLIYMDNKKRKSKGKYVISRIKKNTEEQRIMSMSDSGMEFHYTIYIDKFVWNHLEENDQISLLRRLLCQCKIDHDNTIDVYKTYEPEISDWYSEIEFNKDDPRWLIRVQTMAESLYDDETEVEGLE